VADDVDDRGGGERCALCLGEMIDVALEESTVDLLFFKDMLEVTAVVLC
jgi:hypothetical protein